MVRTTGWLAGVVGVCIGALMVCTSGANGAAGLKVTPEMCVQSDVPVEVDAPDPSMTKIVLISDAHTPSKAPGGHEYFAGLALLADQLKQTKGVWPVMVKDGWPTNEKILDGAKAVVFYCDGGGKQGFLANEQRVATMQKLADAGVGLVIIHQTVDFPKNYADQGASWFGGVWVRGYSDSNRGHWDSTHDNFPQHPVTRGVTAWSMNDGWLGHLKFVDGLKGVTPLVWSGKKHLGSPEGGEYDITGWAYDRPGGGRSFGFSGLDAHYAWAADGLRRFVVNGVLWSAGVDIPETGAKCDLDTATMNRHFDPLPAKK